MERDKYHSRAKEIYKDYLDENRKECVTSIFVLEETFNLSVFRGKGNPNYVDSISSLFLGEKNFFQIINFIPKEMLDIEKVLRTYLRPKRLLSFTDASLIYLYQVKNAECIISFDGHFDQIVERMY